MADRKQWFTVLKQDLSTSPFASNVVFSFILVGVEKLVELEFKCPCNPTHNGWFSSAYFIVPPVVSIMLTLIIQGCRCQSEDKQETNKKQEQEKCWSTFFFWTTTFVPAFVWLILVFLDGQYFACAMTDWHGIFMILDKAVPQKWCEPTSEGDVPLDLMLRSQEFFMISQGIGMGLVLFGSIAGLIVYLVKKKKEKNKPSEENKPSELVEMNINQEEQQPMRP